MRRMMTKKKIIQLIEQYGGKEEQFNIVANVDMSQDPLNPTITITSQNIFNELISYIKTYNKTPKVYILYNIGGDSYNTPISTIRYGYATKKKNADIDELILYASFFEITGIGEGNDYQKVMMRVRLVSNDQSAIAKIRITTNE